MASESDDLPDTSRDYNAFIESTDVELLRRAWRHEKAAPDIIQFESSLVRRIKEQIQLMEDNIEGFEDSGTDPLIVSLYQMDIDRAQFLLRSYLRTRLQKIEKYMIHVSETETKNMLSEEEQEFSRRCVSDMEEHLNLTILSRLPEFYRSIRKQSSSSDENDMVPEPPVDAFVFCRSNGFLGSVQLNDRDDPLNIDADDIYILPYKSIKPLLDTRQIDLI